MSTATAPTLPAQRTPEAQAWDLVEATQAGDRDAFAAIYRRYHDTVFRYVSRRVGSDRATTEDITADVFLRAWGAVDRLRWQGRDVGAWLVTIARNRVNDHYKSARWRRQVLVPDVRGEDLRSDEHHPDPARLVEDAYAAGLVRAALGRLSDDQRLCLQLRYLQGMSIAETAKAMNKNEGAIKALSYRATRALARSSEVAELRGRCGAVDEETRAKRRADR